VFKGLTYLHIITYCLIQSTLNHWQPSTVLLVSPAQSLLAARVGTIQFILHNQHVIACLHYT